MLYYTWKDIERYIYMRRNDWKTVIAAIDVYSDEIIAYVNEETQKEAAYEKICDIFPRNMDKEQRCIRLDRDAEPVRVSLEIAEDIFREKKVPLFKQAIYNDSVYPEEKLNTLPCPVVVFHSYKGGVGRTLSLLAFAKAWTNVHGVSGKEKMLIVDSDLEAPGLTWIQGERSENDFSYLDLLTFIQDMDSVEDIVENAVNEIGNLSVTIETGQQKIQHLFLPTFRYDEQLFDLYASPDTVTKSKNKEYVLAEVLAKIADRMGASLVLVDLRAGISEYSAPLLLDPRTKKFFVTSTSYQSVLGTQKVLQYVSKGLSVTETANLPTVFLSMVPDTLGVSEKNDIVGQFVKCFDVNEENARLLDNMVIELPFASELVHLTNMQQILEKLKGRDMYSAIERFVDQNFALNSSAEVQHPAFSRGAVLKKIHDFAHDQITAEANGAAELLLTEPIKNLCTRYVGRIPTVVAQGAKGSGKTFLYRQLLKKKDWASFCDGVVRKRRRSPEGYFLPVIAPKNTAQINEYLKECIETVQDKFSFSNISPSVYFDNSQKLERVMEKRKIDWMQFWEQLFSASVNEKFHSFQELSDELKKCNGRIVFLIDGLEEILRNVSISEEQQKAVRVLCQDIVNMIMAKYENIGMIIFLRSDMAQNAITVNYEQFKQSHGYAELKWSSEEALRLAVWMVSLAVDGFYEGNVPIENASREVIDKHLEKLWGLKLGRLSSNEAYSSRWILAALSDFNGQLQARDIIRFFEFAADTDAKNGLHEDRILMPTEIRKAVARCSTEKIKEIKTEYASLNPILEKLEKLPSEKKLLPLNFGNDILTAMDEKLMMQAGYLTRDGDKLYLPEIIRHGLGFHYEKGARPKVLSLLLKH